MGNTAQHCRLGPIQDSNFDGDLGDSKSTSAGILCIVGSRTFVTISWMCRKQTSVTHRSTESAIISLDVGSRMDGPPALDLGRGDRCVTFIEEYRITNPWCSRKLLAKSQIQTQRETEMLTNCRMWTTSPQTLTLLKVSLSCTSLKITKQ